MGTATPQIIAGGTATAQLKYPESFALPSFPAYVLSVVPTPFLIFSRHQVCHELSKGTCSIFLDFSIDPSATR